MISCGPPGANCSLSSRSRELMLQPHPAAKADPGPARGARRQPGLVFQLRPADSASGPIDIHVHAFAEAVDDVEFLLQQQIAGAQGPGIVPQHVERRKRNAVIDGPLFRRVPCRRIDVDLVAAPEELPGEVPSVGLGAASGRVEIHVRESDFHQRPVQRVPVQGEMDQGRRQFTLSSPLVKPSRGRLPRGAESARIPSPAWHCPRRMRAGPGATGWSLGRRRITC